MSDREYILSRIRKTTARVQKAAPDAASIMGRISSVPHTADVVDTFIQRVEHAGGKVGRSKDADEARQWIEAYIQRYGLKRCVAPDAVFELLGGRPETVAVSTAELSERGTAHDMQTLLLDAACGITAAHAGFADCGAVLIETTPDSPRTISLLVEAHIAILRTADIHDFLPGIGPFLQHQFSSSEPRNLTFVGGPSKTADIEKTLVKGVHGPREFTVLLLDF